MFITISLPGCTSSCIGQLCQLCVAPSTNIHSELNNEWRRIVRRTLADGTSVGAYQRTVYETDVTGPVRVAGLLNVSPFSGTEALFAVTVRPFGRPVTMRSARNTDNSARQSSRQSRWQSFGHICQSWLPEIQKKKSYQYIEHTLGSQLTAQLSLAVASTVIGQLDDE